MEIKKRELTGIFLRVEIDGKHGNYDVSDLPWEEVEKWLTSKSSVEALPFAHSKNCLDILIKSLCDLLNFINDYKSESDPALVSSNLYGTPIEQCRQCLSMINMLADVHGISTVRE